MIRLLRHNPIVKNDMHVVGNGILKKSITAFLERSETLTSSTDRMNMTEHFVNSSEITMLNAWYISLK